MLGNRRVDESRCHASQVSYNFSLPYEKTVQIDGLVYPVRVWRDAEKGVTRMDTFGGRNILITTKVGLCMSING